MKALELKVPPLLLLFVVGLLMWFNPLLSGPFIFSGQGIFSAVLFLAGIGVITRASLTLRRARTTLNPFTPEATNQLITHDIYRYSRNPIYLAMLLMLAAWAVQLGQISNLPLLILFVLYLNLFQIKPEEKALQQRFGEVWLRYQQNTRRWL